MARMFFSVDKAVHSLARRARRRGLVLLSWALRPGVAGVFLVTTLFGPASGWGQSRAAQMLAGVQHDDFSTAAEDGGHFSPERLRARILSLDMMVAAHNARFARLWGRAPSAGGAGDDVALGCSEAGRPENSQTAAQTNADAEMRRARFSPELAAAGGHRTFRRRQTDRFKGGRVQPHRERKRLSTPSAIPTGKTPPTWLVIAGNLHVRDRKPATPTGTSPSNAVGA
ncbi:MAG: hypothetical protein IPN23_07745 [Elusimicrobia bacterium]|nr:hypothetical protein [Elusimicrobiota bacterium]